jgi:hypothetical protein
VVGVVVGLQAVGGERGEAGGAAAVHGERSNAVGMRCICEVYM